MADKSDKTPGNQYLPEDQDLLSELESVGNARDTFAERERRVSEIQIKAILRSRKTADNFDKSTSRFSIILAAFAMIQIIIALMQFLLDAETTTKKWIGFVLVAICAIFVVLILRFFNKILKEK